MKCARRLQYLPNESYTRTLYKAPRTSQTAHGTSNQSVLQHRSVRYATTFRAPTRWFKKNWDEAKREYPVLLPVSVAGAVTVMSILGLLIYDELTRIAPQYSAYPDAVEQRLRYALHLTHVQADPDGATKYFSEALKSAYGEGMDPFSKEVLGIRIRWAEMLEKFGRAKGAVEILNDITKDCENKLAEIDTSNQQTQDYMNRRSALLKNIIQTRVKAASIYESEYLQDAQRAKSTLSQAVSLLVKETRDPETLGFNGDNAAGLTLEEISSILSQMGDLYATTGEESNAVQVYMLTLAPLRQSCNGTKSCKEVQILSNIASTMTVAMKRPGAAINGKPPTKASMEAARRATLKWAEQAIGTAEKVQPTDRDQMCELGLISAEMTKADLLLESGQNTQARELFRSLIPRLKEKNLQALVSVAEQSLVQVS